MLERHDHYSHGRNKEALIDGLKAFESTLKIICNERGFPFDPHDTSKKLIAILLNNNFIPIYHESNLAAIRNTLESGIPTVRNKTSGHGQGVEKITVDDSLASYGLNITGYAIRFLVENL